MSNEEKILRSLELLKEIGYKSDSIKAIKHVPAQEGKYEDYPDGVHPALREALAAKGFTRLFSHQRSTWEALKERKNVVVVTPTASGKTLCYNLPVLDAILKEPRRGPSTSSRPRPCPGPAGRARRHRLAPPRGGPRLHLRRRHAPGRAQGHPGPRPHRPDQPRHAPQRHPAPPHQVDQALREPPLRRHRRAAQPTAASSAATWPTSCGGSGGSARFYGSDPQFICSLGDDRQPGGAGRDDDRGAGRRSSTTTAPRAARSTSSSTTRRSSTGSSASAAPTSTSRAASPRVFLKNGLQTIVFAGSRLITEVLVTYLKEDIETNIQKEGLIRGYRGGYLPLKRREIEKGLRDGRDPGRRLDQRPRARHRHRHARRRRPRRLPGHDRLAPGSRPAGPAARPGTRPPSSWPRARPLDQFIVNNPDYFFAKSPGEGPASTPTTCRSSSATSSAPPSSCPSRTARRSAGPRSARSSSFLEEEKLLHHSKDKWYWTCEAYPADAVSLRSISSDNFVVVDVTGEARVIAEVDFTAALTALHDKAIYILEGEQYFVEKLDYEERKAYVKRPTSTTTPTPSTTPRSRILDVFDKKAIEAGTGRISHGEVHVATQVVGFKKIKFHTHGERRRGRAAAARRTRCTRRPTG